MRFFRKLFIAGCCAASVALQATPAEDARIFQETIRNVDMNGVYLDYVNTVAVFQLVDSLPEKATVLLGSRMTPQLQMGISLVRSLLRTLNLPACKAHAASSRTLAPDLHLTRTFAYFGKSISEPGIASLPGNANIPWPRLQQLPLDTRIALGAYLSPVRFWQSLQQAAMAGGDPVLQMTLMQIPQLVEAQTQIRFNDLLDSMEGAYEFILIGGTGNPEICITFPDRKGLLGRMLRQMLGTKTNTVALPATQDLHPSWKPEIRMEKDRVLLLSSPSALARLNQTVPGGLLASKAFAPHAKLLPRRGVSYAVLNFDEALRGELLALMPPEDRKNFVRAFPQSLFRLCAVAERAPDGFAGRLTTNISVPELMAVLPFASSIVSALPSLSALKGTPPPQAGQGAAPKMKSRPQKEACAEQLKLLGRATMVYAAEHNDTLPPSGKAGLKAAAQNCPGGKIPGDYVFLGGYPQNKFQNPATIPLAFDKPGRHGDVVHVLFLDGHVMKIRVTRYQSAAQVLGALHQRCRYKPEDLRFLQQKLAEQ